MDNIIDQIHYDHISLSKVLTIMEQEVQRILSDMEPDYELLVDGMRYMINYSDSVHHHKEDAIFARLSEKDPDLKQTIDDLLQQHRSLANLSAQFYNIVTSASLGEVVSKQEMLDISRDYTKFLRQHMRQEEGDVLRKAKKLLSEDDLKEIDKIYSDFRDPLLSESLEQWYNALYQRLMA